MLIDPIDSVRLIQSLQAHSHPAPFSSHPHRPQLIFFSKHTHTHFTNAMCGIQIHISQAMEFLFTLLLPHNGHPLFRNDCNGNFCCLSKYVLLYAFIHMSNCNAMSGLARKYDMSHVVTSHHCWTD